MGVICVLCACTCAPPSRLTSLLPPAAARFDARRDLEDIQAAGIPVVTKVRQLPAGTCAGILCLCG
jgi:hypothetical protein